MLKINCDIGERGVAHPVDDRLMQYIDIANIACGGHAGDQQSVDYYLSLCHKHKVRPSAHVGYPDPENFGRKRMEISNRELFDSLDKQIALFPSIEMIKPHGALYFAINDSDELAQMFVDWCIKNNLSSIINTPFGHVAKICQKRGDITLLRESFVERGYFLKENAYPELIPRGQSNAEIKEVSQAVEQYNQLLRGFITIDGTQQVFYSDTACIHSDSSIALELVKAIRKMQ